MKLFLGLFTLFPTVFFCIGTGMVYLQQHRIRSYLPVSAKVLDSRVEVHTHLLQCIS